MRPNDDNEAFPEDPDDEIDAVEPPFAYGPQGPRPKVRARWGSFAVQLEVGFGDDIPSRARLKLADEVATWMASDLSRDDIKITMTSHAWVVQASIGGADVTAHFAPHGDWFPAVKEQVYALVVTSFATDPWNHLTWVD